MSKDNKKPENKSKEEIILMVLDATLDDERLKDYKNVILPGEHNRSITNKKALITQRYEMLKNDFLKKSDAFKKDQIIFEIKRQNYTKALNLFLEGQHIPQYSNIVKQTLEQEKREQLENYKKSINTLSNLL